jgi:Protein of unknown function (DUF1688)
VTLTTSESSPLLSARAVRERSQQLLQLALEDRLEHWRVELGQLRATAQYVARIVRDRYPQLAVPVHARWRHFVSGDVDLWKTLTVAATWGDAGAKARAAFDLVILSVLLDAGAGAGWQYFDARTGAVAMRSEGLALASVRWFEAGGLSDQSAEPLRVDAAALCRLDSHALRTAFQVSGQNELLGLDGRIQLMQRLGRHVQSRPDLFAVADSPRPGGVYDVMCARSQEGQLRASEVLEILLDAFGPIWEGRPVLDGVALGDCWPHPALDGPRPEDSFVPLHKLSQWLTYSLIEPLQAAGIRVIELDGLTGLAEYRNGGLLSDSGVLVPRHDTDVSRIHEVSDPFVVGWRSLTVALLDRLHPLVCAQLGLDAQRFPLANMLEGGTWAAGRQLARERRQGGSPPFNIQSDGTVF